MIPHGTLASLGCVHARTYYVGPGQIIEAAFPHVVLRKYPMLKCGVVAGPSRSCCFPVMILDSEPDMIIPAGGQPGRLTCVPVGCYQLLSYTFITAVSVTIHISKPETDPSRNMSDLLI